jgi:hypothetical protein
VTRAATHVHDWGPVVLIDRCHATDEEYTCRECGEIRMDAEPRDFSEPGQVAFADESCHVCRTRVALAGVWPDAWGAM